MCEFTLLYAPNINSYKRFQAGSFAPTAIAWGYDNRTCSLRVVGHGAGLRLENRLPGGDVNPYLALAGMLAGGLHGIEQELELEPAFAGNAYESDNPKVPTSLRAARDLFAGVDDGPRGLRRRGRRPLRQRRRRRARRRSTPPSPTGSASGASRGCERGRGRSRGTHEVVDPATEEHVTTVDARPRSRRPTRPIARAHAAFEQWRQVAPADRGRLLRRFADAVDGAREELAALEVRNSGHTISNARWEAGNVRDVLDYYSAAPERLFGRQIPVAGGVDITFKEPLGVVGVIVPWNFPMPIAGWGFAPALAAGNTVVLKPAELTPLTAVRLGELALEAGLPRGRVHRAARQGLGGRRPVRHPPAGAQDRASPARPRSARGIMARRRRAR